MEIQAANQEVEIRLVAVAEVLVELAAMEPVPEAMAE
jgi:hypothetical protein